MSSVLNAQRLYSRMMTVKSLVRLSKTVHPKHGSCQFCSSAPKSPKVTQNQMDRSKEEDQNELLNYQKTLIRSIESWYGLRSKTTPYEGVEDTEIFENGFKLKKDGTSTHKVPVTANQHESIADQGIGDIGVSPGERFERDNTQYRQSHIDPISHTNVSKTDRVKLLHESQETKYSSMQRTDIDYRQHKRLSPVSGTNTQKTEQTGSMETKEGIINRPTHALQGENSHTVMHDAVSMETTSNTLSLGHKQHSQGTKSKPENHRLHYTPDKFNSKEYVQEMIHSFAQRQPIHSRKEIKDLSQSERIKKFQDRSLYNMFESQNTKQKKIQAKKKEELEAKHKAEANARQNIETTRKSEPVIPEAWLKKLKVLVNQQTPKKKKKDPVIKTEQLTSQRTIESMNEYQNAYSDVYIEPPQEPPQLTENQLLEKLKLKRYNPGREEMILLKAEQRMAKERLRFTSYLEVSMVTGMLIKAMRDFESLRTSSGLVTLTMYNILLRGIANTLGNMQKMKLMCTQMEEDNIAPNMETFVYRLVKIGETLNDTLKYGPDILEQMAKRDLDITNVFNVCELTAKEASRVVTVMQTLRPDVTLKPRFSVQDLYTESLAIGLNTPAQLKPVDISSQVKLADVLDQSKVQFAREEQGYVKIPSVWKGKMSPDEREVKEKQFEKLLQNWQEVVETKFDESLLTVKEDAFCNSKYNIYPYLCIFSKKDYVEILMDVVKEWVGINPYFSPDLRIMAMDIGQIVFDRYMIHYNQMAGSNEALRSCYEEYIQRTLKDEQRCTKYRQVWQDIASKVSPYTPTKLLPQSWDAKIKRDVGDFLLRIILENLTFEHISKDGKRHEMKCFSTVQRLRSKRTIIEMQRHPRLDNLCYQAYVIKKADQVPMLCPPLPHISPKFGGTLLNTVYIMKSNYERHVDWLNEINPTPFLDSLTILSSSAWVVNKPVLDIVLHFFKQGGDSELGIPLHPSKIVKPPKTAEYNEKAQYKQELNNATSLWYSEMYKYSIADMFKDEVIWLPNTVDFRGRCYPTSVLNHQGNDVIRGLMKFAEFRPLGKEGLDWLKIHLVNLTGLKKRDTIRDRLKYADEIIDEITDSADDPLNGRKWWTKSETPIQTLAACMELTNALRSPDPMMFYSNFPIHQDGSCNGLQHYAALGLDVDGAKSVNLHPSEIPSDVYSTVVDVIREEVEKEIGEKKAKNEKIEDNDVAVLANKYLERKIIKQSIMTQVYGVTRYGVKKQIVSQIQDTDCPAELCDPVAFYLTQKCFQSLDNIFQSGKQIQSWFTKCSSIISCTNSTVDWVTPLNFPVCQQYFKDGIDYADNSPPPVNMMKQTNGFPPNFIHSLDATHMMLTALYCHREGIRFGSVHDSFWTHACDLETMNKVTREQFVALHKQDILQNLANFFVKTYDEVLRSSLDEENYEDTVRMLMNLPQKGNFDLNLVKKSTYFFS